MNSYGPGALSISAHPINFVLALVEIVFIFVVAFLATTTWRRFWGGRFGKGMGHLAISLYIMGIGHIGYFLEAFFGYSIFGTIFGSFGVIALLLALILTWFFAILAFRAFLKEIKIPLPPAS